MVELERLNKTYHRKNLTTAQPTNPADGIQPPLIHMFEGFENRSNPMYY